MVFCPLTCLSTLHTRLRHIWILQATFPLLFWISSKTLETRLDPPIDGPNCVRLWEPKQFATPEDCNDESNTDNQVPWISRSAEFLRRFRVHLHSARPHCLVHPTKVGVIVMMNLRITLGVMEKIDTWRSLGGCIVLHITAIYVVSLGSHIKVSPICLGGTVWSWRLNILNRLCNTLTPLLYFHPLYEPSLLTIIIISLTAVDQALLLLALQPPLIKIWCASLVLFVYFHSQIISHLCTNLLATLALQLVGVGVRITVRHPLDPSPSYWIVEQISTYSTISPSYKTYNVLPVWARIF